MIAERRRNAPALLKGAAVELRVGDFYRNGLGQVVMLVGTIVPGSSWYAKGCRFVDSRGNFYLVDGTMDTWLWKSLELIGEVDWEEVSEEQFRQIQEWSPELLTRVKRGTTAPAPDESLLSPSSSASKQSLPAVDRRRGGSEQDRVAPASRADGAQLVSVRLSPQALNMFNAGAQAALQSWDVASLPSYGAWFDSAGEAFVDAAGKRHPEIRNSAKQITEKAKIRKVRISPAKMANIAFEVASFLVAQEHLARIDRNLSEIASNLADLKSTILDEIAAPIHVAAASLDRLSRPEETGLPPEVVRSWLLDLRKSRERLVSLAKAAVAKVEAVPKRSSGLKTNGLRAAMARVREANSLIELLMTCDALIDRYQQVYGDRWAADRVDIGLPRHLAESLHDLGREFIARLLSNKVFELRVGVEFQLFPDLQRTRDLIDVQDRAEQARALLPVLESGREFVISIDGEKVIKAKELVPA